ncbi:hypothetical protein [Lysobacter gummosus]|uniref:hypothetical protein n=1 Tax=Lysobacter gummosus TaxID=262324 RepID=UPI00363D44FD
MPRHRAMNGKSRRGWPRPAFVHYPDFGWPRPPQKRSETVGSRAIGGVCPVPFMLRGRERGPRRPEPRQPEPCWPG